MESTTLPDPYFECIDSNAAYHHCADCIVYPSEFAGNYADPNHEGCPRQITMKDKDATITGADGPDGKNCPDGQTGEPFTVYGKVDCNHIIIDFSPKGGPKDLHAYWDGSGIVFEDGNKWEKTMGGFELLNMVDIIETESS